MTAVSPARTPPAFTALPQPVGTPHPTRTAVLRGSHSSPLTTEYWEMVARSENVPSMHSCPMSRPLAWYRKLPSMNSPFMRWTPRLHRFDRPLAQYRQVPQLGMKLQTTWSPSLTRVTP